MKSILKSLCKGLVVSGVLLFNLAFLHSASASYSSIIDVDFGAGTSASLETGFAATGLTSSDFWNWYTRDDGSGGYLTFGSLALLQFVDGTTSGAGLTVANAPGAWGNGTSDPMYDGYLYPGGGGNITVTITNLDPGVYDFYLYGHGNYDDQDSTFDVQVDATDFGSVATTATSGWNSVAWTEGMQYVVIRSVSVLSSTQTVTITISPKDSYYAILAGMQIAKKVSNLIDVDILARELPPHWKLALPPSVKQPMTSGIGTRAMVFRSMIGALMAFWTIWRM